MSRKVGEVMPLIPETLTLTAAKRVDKIKASAPVRWRIVGSGEVIDELPQQIIVHATDDTPFTVVAAAIVGEELDACTVSVERSGWTLPSLAWAGKLVPSKKTAGIALLALVVAAVLFGGGYVVRDWIKPHPPGPTPTPVPPVPPAPIPGAGLRALVLYETADAAKLSKGQLDGIYGKAARDYLNAKCAVSADGKTKEWRIFDKDVDPKDESKIWQDAVAKLKATPGDYPKTLISNGTTGFAGALPDDFLALVKKYEAK